MICYFVTPQHRYTMLKFLELVPEARELVTIIPYGDPRRLEIPADARRFIFSDIERLVPATAEHLAALTRDLARRAGFQALNHPTRSMRRYELLRTLYEQGKNVFDVYRLAEGRMPRRWPVFLREEHEHRGPISKLIPDAATLRQVLQSALDRGMSRENKLIVEYVDTSDNEGFFHKLSAFRVRDRIVPRHRFASRGWCVKAPDVVDEPHASRERQYLESNDHEKELLELFRLARIEYGRIDYVVHRGKMQVWEINTNPMIFRAEHFQDPVRAPVHEQCRTLLVEALRQFAA